METKLIPVVQVAHDSAQAGLTRPRLANSLDIPISGRSMGRLHNGAVRMRASDTNIVLLNLSLQDSHGFATFNRVHKRAPDVPISVGISGLLERSYE